VAEDPRRPAAKPEPGLDPSTMFHRLRHSLERVPDPPGRVGRPRRVLVHRVAADGVLDIVGPIPDALPRPVALPHFVPEG
jgi:hypothetical protein